MMLFAAEDASWIRSMIDSVAYGLDRFGWPGAMVVLAIAALIWYARTFGPDHKREIEGRTMLIGVLTEHLPKQTKTLGAMQECLVESRKRESDIMRAMGNIADGMDNVAVAVIAGACSDRVEVASAHLKEHLARVEKRKNEAKK